MLTFTSRKGNSYVYVNQIGIIFPLLNNFKSIFQMLNNELIESNDYISKWEPLLIMGYEQKYSTPTPEKIEEMILGRDLQQLILEVTEACNLRCKYCIYTDDYKTRRNFSEKKMSWSTAKKAIDYYITLFNKSFRKNPNSSPVFSFYGGEPLLNFKLIEKSVNYIKKQRILAEPKFNITTNGTLLDRTICNFLIKNNFLVAISLDGSKEEQDRNRVDIMGQGTFDRIKANIDTYNMLLSINTLKDSLYCLPVCDFKTDMIKVDEFFNNSQIPDVARISFVSTYPDSKYHRHFSKEDKDNFHENLENAFDMFLGSLNAKAKNIGPYLEKWFLNSFEDVLIRPGMLHTLDSMFPATGSCIPGKKIFVTIDGSFHACEKLPLTYPLGDVENGIEWIKVHEMIERYQEMVIKKCLEKKCPVTRLCNTCYVHFMEYDHFHMKESVCKSKIDLIKKNLSKAVSISEETPSLLDRDLKYYQQLSQYIGGE